MKNVSNNWGTKEWFESKFVDADTRGDRWFIHLRASQSFRMQLCQSLIQELVTSQAALHILDAGCGLGLFIERLSAVNPNNRIYGCDISENAISYNRKKFPDFQFDVNTLPSLKYESEAFDLICALEVVYYLDDGDRRTSFEEICRCLKKGGYFLFSGGINRGERYFEEKNIRDLTSEYFDIMDIVYNNAKIYGYIEKLLLGILIMAGIYENGSIRNIDKKGITSIPNNKIFLNLAKTPLQILKRPAQYLLSNIKLVSVCNYLSKLLLQERGRTHIIVLARKPCTISR